MRILLVEDNPGDVDLICENLLSSPDTQYEIQDVERFSRALEILANASFDIILLDLGLPDSNGLEALEILRRKFPDIPVIVITGMLDEETGIRAVQSGAQDYLVKQNVSPSFHLTRVITHAVERATSEKKIRESEHFLRATLDSLSALIVIIDNKGMILLSNRAWDGFFQDHRPEIAGWAGKNYLELLKNSESRSVSAIVSGIEEIFADKRTVFEAEIFFKIMEKGYWFKIIAKPFSGMQWNRAVMTHENITQKKENELHLKASQEKFKSIINHIGTGVLLVDRNRRIVETNSLVKQWFPELGKRPPMPFDALFPGVKEEGCPVRQTFTAGRSCVATIELADATYRVVSSPLFDGKPEAHSVVLLMEDITKRLAREKKMRQIQKMEAIGTLAGGIAHDFNNILTGILGYTELALAVCPPGNGPLSDYLTQTQSAGKRAAALVKQILTFSKKSEVELQPLDLKPIVREALKLIRSTIPTTIKIKQEIKGSLGLVLADATQIHQIIMNLCTNAAAAMEKNGGRMDVALRFPDSFETEELKSGTGHLVLEVKDTGTGMTAETMESIFLPYFTTRDMDEGTGLGLSVVHGIVTDYNGQILVTSEVGKGSVFKVCLPLCESVPAEEEGTVSFEIPGTKGCERILIVDDELPILEVGKKILEKNGYQVVTMADSLAALEAVRENPVLFDLVITDLTMPKLTGDRLALKIKEENGKIPVILWTGYNDLLSQEEMSGMGIVSIIWKPFSKEELFQQVRKALDNRSL